MQRIIHSLAYQRNLCCHYFFLILHILFAFLRLMNSFLPFLLNVYLFSTRKYIRKKDKNLLDYLFCWDVTFFCFLLKNLLKHIKIKCAFSCPCSKFRRDCIHSSGNLSLADTIKFYIKIIQFSFKTELKNFNIK